ncbi:MAG TPA: FtsW/RodA/SpoVE family cell cycle protein [Clostridiales bacterium]|nr:FtsW/RodA/SpoVE family cell cycle protein [Clostridiales bacterium]
MKKIWQLVSDFLKRADMLLFSLCAICTIFGIVLISSATRTYDNPSRFIIVQVLAFFIGIGLFVILTIIDIDIIADKWAFLFVFNIFFLLLLIPFGVGAEETGNRGWLRFLGIGIQPSEVVKVVYIVLMAKHISYLREYKNLNSPLSLVQLVFHFAFMFGLIVFVSDDLGSALVFLFIFVVMLFVAGVKLYWFAIGAAGVAALTPFVWNNFLSENQKERILAPYVSSIDPAGFGIKWQSNQSKLALASGQLTGTGLYNGPQTQSNALSQKHTDFIFSVAGEELGMIACCFIMLLLLLIVIRCVYIGIKSRNTMNMLVCFGVASVVFFQTFENIGMCIGITPVIGITLPFFSYGGSSLFSLFAAMGLVSGIKFRPKPERFHSNV